MELTPEQVRVLGCLVEKEATTPDQYPLSSHALTTACNQKNNRDPLVAYGEREVDGVMLELRQLGLARTVHAANARVAKHKHVLDEAWGLDPRELSVLAVMMLRGPNTLNELRIRTERYVDWDSHDAVLAVVHTLEQRDPPYIVELGRQIGQRETRFTHLLEGEPVTGSPAPDVERTPAPVRAAPAEATAAPAPVPPPGGPDLAAEVHALRAEVGELRARLDELARRLGEDV
jgi:uncharacterized protein YceH (UPF0502 family)